jgi:hypothetical protein
MFSVARKLKQWKNRASFGEEITETMHSPEKSVLGSSSVEHGFSVY